VIPLKELRILIAAKKMFDTKGMKLALQISSHHSAGKINVFSGNKTAQTSWPL
jgi:hypothetical protein